MSNPVDSAVVVARLLSTEGFTNHVANQVRRYWRRSVLDERRRKRIERIEQAFREQVVPKLSDADRLVLGRFISIHERMSFDTGLRVGLTANMYPEGEQE